MTPPSTTFAIPCRDGAAHLRGLLESLLAQTRQDFELLLVDDASRDGSADLARRVAGDRIRIERNREPLGLGGNWNRCAELVDTPFFCIAHVDDVYDPAFLATQLAALEAEPTAAFVHCRAHGIDERGHVVDSPIERYKDGFWTRCTDPSAAHQFALLRLGNFVMCPSIVYRTEAFRTVGPYDPALRATLDWQHHVRTTLAGHAIVAVPEARIAYRRHASSVTSSNVRSLARYREEAELLRWIDARGRERGWIDEAASPSPALRNNLLYDAFVDFRAGEVGRARERLRFARDEEPDLAWDTVARLVAAGIATGPPGRIALASALQAIVWRAELRFALRRLAARLAGRS